MKSTKIENRQRKHLSADALFARLHSAFEEIPDSRTGEVNISLSDALMSAFAMFSLKDPSLLAFDKRRCNDHNLRTIYNIENVPCDTQMRTILDEVSPEALRPMFKDVFRQLQRGKALEPMVFFKGCYLLSLDGTGYFLSKKIHSNSCLEKINRKTGKVTYYQQILGGAIVHPDFREVIPLAPELITKQDGQTKNDCERNAAKRFIGKLRKDHPHLRLILVEDSLSSNAPHIRDLQEHDLHYILGVKRGDHSFLFDYVDAAESKGKTTEFEYIDKEKPDVVHRFRFINHVPLNESNQDLLVNFLEYWEIAPDKTQHFSWVTDFILIRENVYQIMRGGRARWRIENETFNTLKNQGYNFEHNYGLGKKNLSMVFAMLTMLAFLVDQTQQLCSALFQAAWRKIGSKKALWENMRSLFQDFKLDSMEMLYKALFYGIELQKPIVQVDTS